MSRQEGDASRCSQAGSCAAGMINSLGRAWPRDGQAQPKQPSAPHFQALWQVLAEPRQQTYLVPVHTAISTPLLFRIFLERRFPNSVQKRRLARVKYNLLKGKNWTSTYLFCVNFFATLARDTTMFYYIIFRVQHFLFRSDFNFCQKFSFLWAALIPENKG